MAQAKTATKAKRAAAATPSVITHTSAPLYTHEPHPHTPRNANERHAEERAALAAQPGWRGRVAAFNEALAVWLTRHTGSMLTAYLFAGIGIGSLVGVFTGNVFLAALFGSISSYFLQLVLLPVLSVGQNVLSRHAEIQADEQYHTSLRNSHDLGQLARHLDAQDAELLAQRALLETLAARMDASNAPSSSPMASSAPMTATPPSASPLLASATAPRKRPRALASTSPTA